MKLLAKIGLSDSEQKLLKKVALISTGASLIVILSFWLISSLTASTKTKTGLPGISNKPELNTLDLDAHQFTAIHYLQSNQPEKAIVHLQRILIIKKDDRIALERLSQAYLEYGNFEKSLSTIDYLISLWGDSLPAYLYARKGAALYYLGRYEESSNILNQAISQFPDDPEALCFLGQIEAAKAVPSKAAEAFYKRALAADSTHVETIYQLARYYESCKEYLKARLQLLKVLEIEPLHVRAHARLGMVYFYLGSNELALKSYQTALALNPEDFNTRYNLAELFYTRLNDNRSALQEFTLALEYYPLHTEANYKAGLICIENDMVKEAIRYFEASLKTDPQNITKLLQTAAAYERLGDREKALEEYHRITEQDPLHSIALQKIKFLNVK